MDKSYVYVLRNDLTTDTWEALGYRVDDGYLSVVNAEIIATYPPGEWRRASEVKPA